MVDDEGQEVGLLVALESDTVRAEDAIEPAGAHVIRRHPTFGDTVVLIKC